MRWVGLSGQQQRWFQCKAGFTRVRSAPSLQLLEKRHCFYFWKFQEVSIQDSWKEVGANLESGLTRFGTQVLLGKRQQQGKNGVELVFISNWIAIRCYSALICLKCQPKMLYKIISKNNQFIKQLFLKTGFYLQLDLHPLLLSSDLRQMSKAASPNHSGKVGI